MSNSHTKFGWISSNGLDGDSVTDEQIDGWMDRQTFWPLPRGGAKRIVLLHAPIHVSNLHTKFGWISSSGLGGDSVTVGRTEVIAIFPSLF